MATVITAGNATNGLSFTSDNTGSLDIKTGTGAGTTAISISSSQIATFAGAASVPGNLSFNSGYGSSAVAYGCRAWVNFNGTGTVVRRASGNVSSITDNGTGDYTVNFDTAMPDANYVAVASSQQTTSATALVTWAPRIASLAVGSFKVSGVPEGTTSGAVVDVVEVRCAVFR